MNRIYTKLAFLMLTLVWVSNPAFSQDMGILRPIQITEEPVIDGVLDEAIWQQATMVTGFKTYVPDYEADMAYQTKVFMANDEDNLYFGFIAYDDPNEIKTSIAARDRIRDDDWIGINLDSFYDQQSLFSFYVNPSGIQMDGKAVGRREDMGIDMVWYSAGNITEEGYVVEIKIPFKSIRYRNGEPVTMGVVFERKISRFSQMGTYPALDPQKGMNFMIQTNKIEYSGVKKFTLLELLPAVTYQNKASHQEGELKTDINRAEVGLTAKYGITSDLIFDMTVNPDFSQVEADAGQVDVNQRFAIFFPERRPFFLEGNESFNFAQTGGRDAIRSVVNTRTIVNPLGAAKLTGKIGGLRNTVASIFALDEIHTDDRIEGGATHAKVGVLRYRRAFKDDTYLGAVYTSREHDGYSNRVAGVDGLYRLSPSSSIDAHYLRSFHRDSMSLPVEDDHSFKIGYAHRTRAISYGGSFADMSDFKSDVGFVTRTQTQRYNLYASPKFYFDKKVLKRIDPVLSATYLYDKPSGLYEHSYWLNGRFNLIRNSEISASYNWKNEIYENQKFSRNNYRLSVRSQIHKRVFFNVSYENGDKIFYDPDNPSQGYGKDMRASLILQLTDKFNSEWRYTFSDFFQREGDLKEYDVNIIRSKNTYQINQYLFFRFIVEYNSFKERMTTDFLASFTYIPGTVVHLGYGGVYNQVQWQTNEYVTSDGMLQTNRGFFFKASYLFRK